MISSLIKSCDLFGVPLELYITDDRKYKSFLGGITSLIIYSLSLMYGIYQLYVWNNNGFLPFVTESSEPMINESFTFTHSPIKMEMARILGGPRITEDVFTSDSNMIIQPLIYTIEGFLPTGNVS
jgi:hypothetical protein